MEAFQKEMQTDRELTDCVDHLPLNHCYWHASYNYSPCSEKLRLITLPFIGSCRIRGLPSSAAVLAKKNNSSWPLYSPFHGSFAIKGYVILVNTIGKY